MRARRNATLPTVFFFEKKKYRFIVKGYNKPNSYLRTVKSEGQASRILVYENVFFENR
jgi:hypothetical protein